MDEIIDVPTTTQARKARQIVAYAVRSGTLQKPSTCAWCGGSKSIQAHHPDYARPLMVVWICQPCHSEHHRKYSEDRRLIGL